MYQNPTGGYGFPPPPPPPQRKNRAWLYGCLGCGGAAAFVLVLGAGCVAFLGSGTDTPPPAESPVAEAPAAGDDEKPAAKIGDSVESGAFAFTVTDVETGVASVQDDTGYITTKADGSYVVVSVTVENVGDESGIFDSTAQKLHDADGKEYSTDAEAQLTEGADSWVNDINPGNKVDGKLIFDVPEGVQPDSVELHDFLSLDGGAVVDLT
ncbi:uncharacterized protein DUF4352 [Murinocardiopsis flavida]|uniref:Uncharacterized protein DUF4352 n=1 Tax=Murinocardiopsis flavida TaxID=645275 RepID=A0A2P8DUX3_9ACTN|nr:DUF4352 domain-containing protein [Murinocardiopsis flavida]PSL01026.1 uncharacterized protein DUF4352 [Murinocardiopsis flavida]